MKIFGWGRFPVIETNLIAPSSETQLKDELSKGDLIARGNGRSYGDSAIGKTTTIDMRCFNRMVEFDGDNGSLVAEAGVLLADIIDVFLPRGWFPIVTPGTKFVTLGGMIAADVHGKNHHNYGSMRNSVNWIDLMTSGGEVIRLSPEKNASLFNWTIGGMGLTGIILRAEIKLRKVSTGWIQQKTIPAGNLEAVIDAFEANDKATYSVAWIDCLAKGKSLGRSLLMMGEHVEIHELPPVLNKNCFPSAPARQISLSVNLPACLMNKTVIRLFNSFYFWLGTFKKQIDLVMWNSFFYPLDRINDWNKLYGKNGFVQFQCVLPLAKSREGLTQLLKATSDLGEGSFLAVLKRFGAQDTAFSFPMEGYTLALDFPVNSSTLELLDTLDRITIEHGGRFYLAKDSRMSQITLEASDPRIAKFREMRQELHMSSAFVSSQSHRLGL